MAMYFPLFRLKEVKMSILFADFKDKPKGLNTFTNVLWLTADEYIHGKITDGNSAWKINIPIENCLH